VGNFDSNLGDPHKQNSHHLLKMGSSTESVGKKCNLHH